MMASGVVVKTKRKGKFAGINLKNILKTLIILCPML